MKKCNKILIITLLFIFTTIVFLFFSKNINIKQKSRIIKQMNESTQISDLQTQIDNLNLEHKEYANYIQTSKRALATAITNEGISTSENDSFETIATNIGNILQVKTSDATATADNISEGKTAYVNGQKITGTSTDSTITIITGTSNPIVYTQSQFINTGSRPKVIFVEGSGSIHGLHDFYIEYNDGTVFQQNKYIIQNVTDNGFTIGSVWETQSSFDYKVVLY